MRVAYAHDDDSLSLTDVVGIAQQELHPRLAAHQDHRLGQTLDVLLRNNGHLNHITSLGLGRGACRRHDGLSRSPYRLVANISFVDYHNQYFLTRGKSTTFYANYQSVHAPHTPDCRQPPALDATRRQKTMPTRQLLYSHHHLCPIICVYLRIFATSRNRSHRGKPL